MNPLTKTDFILYRECSNNVWIKKHNPEEYSKFEVSEFEQSLAVMGNQVEELARNIFPAGILVNGRNKAAEDLTKKLITEHTPIIFQALFATDKYLAASDVLKWNNEAGAYDLYEIKMSSTIEENDDDAEEGKPKKVNKKKELQYEYDLAFQSNVIAACGIKLNKKFLIRLNKEYVRSGELDYTPGRLFVIEDKTEVVDRLMPTALMEMEDAYKYLSQTKQPEGTCSCYYMGRSRHCTAFSYINPHVPAYSVHDLNRIGSSKAYLRELLDAGILMIDKVPEDERLNPKPKKLKEGEKESKPKKLNQVRAHKTQEPIINLDAIKTELNSLTFPLYFLDYETYPTAVPPYNSYHPYQHIVFQYSVHVLRSKDSPLEHFELLILDGDPAERIVDGLRKCIGDTGSVISWYKKFENARNRELAKLVPLQYDFLHSVINRTYDLMDIVEDQHYVHPGFQGRASIKKVLPVLAPELTYKNLAIQSGTGAIEAYRQISDGELTGAELEKKKKEMLEYCGRDTEAMYVIWKFFHGLVYGDK